MSFEDAVCRDAGVWRGLRDKDEAGVCGARQWKEVGEVEKGEERWFNSQEEEEERMEDEADEERTSVGINNGR